MREFQQIEMGIEVSAKSKINIHQMLYCAQTSVIFPLHPLMDTVERSLTTKYKKALTRIFRILDTDFSGTLSDAEISVSQNRVFDNDLEAEDLKYLRDIVKEEVEQN